MPKTEHKLLMSVPLPDRLLVGLRKASGITQLALAAMAGYSHATDLNNIERRRGRDAVRRSTLERLRDALRGAGAGGLQKLDRLVDGDVAWDEVIEVRDTGRVESIFDLSVHGGDRPVENFLAGHGGVLVSNTAGFVDAGWNGQLTLELSNVATLPITLYPGMKIGQISFLAMTTPADHPYGSSAVGSKYQNQVGPRPSRYFENFRDPA
jgi:dCTP deaminase